MKTINILILSILLFIPIIHSFELNGTYTLMTIKNCYEDVTVIDKDDYANDYIFLNFTRNNNKWIQDCKNAPFDIVLDSNATTERIFDFEVLYEIDKINETNTTSGQPPTKQDMINDNNKRYYNFENLKGVPVEIKEKPFKWPSLSEQDKDNLYIVLISFGIVIIIIVLIVIYILFIKNKNEYIEEDESDLDDFFRRQV